MLLMAALMLADRMATLEDERRALKADVNMLESRAHQLRAGLADVPAHVVETLAELAARAEALAEAVEERISPAGH
jgi:cell division protein ZapA